jgi:hypothetical protein
MTPVSQRRPPRFKAGLSGVPEPLRSFLDSRLMAAPGYSVPIRHAYHAWRGTLRGRGERLRFSDAWFREATATLLQGLDPGTGLRVYANLRWRTNEWRPELEPLVLDGRGLVVGRRSLRSRLRR